MRKLAGLVKAFMRGKLARIPPPVEIPREGLATIVTMKKRDYGRRVAGGIWGTDGSRTNAPVFPPAAALDAVLQTRPRRLDLYQLPEAVRPKASTVRLSLARSGSTPNCR